MRLGRPMAFPLLVPCWRAYSIAAADVHQGILYAVFGVFAVPEYAFRDRQQPHVFDAEEVFRGDDHAEKKGQWRDNDEAFFSF